MMNPSDILKSDTAGIYSMKILVGGDTYFLWYVSGLNPFLYKIREQKYKQNNMRHQNSRQKIIQYQKCLIMISNFDVFISQLHDIAPKWFCTPDGATGPNFQMSRLACL